MLTLIREGNEAAFDELFKRYFKQLYTQGFAILRDETLTQEVVHDVLIEIWKGRTDIHIDNLGGYLRVAIRRRSISAITEKKSPKFFDVFDDMIVSPHHADSKLLTADMLELVSSWAEALPEKRRKIFVRYFFSQMSPKEIAAELDMNEKTVYRQISQALETMKEKYAHLLPVLFLLYWKGH